MRDDRFPPLAWLVAEHMPLVWAALVMAALGSLLLLAELHRPPLAQRAFTDEWRCGGIDGDEYCEHRPVVFRSEPPAPKRPDRTRPRP